MILYDLYWYIIIRIHRQSIFLIYSQLIEIAKNTLLFYNFYLFFLKFNLTNGRYII